MDMRLRIKVLRTELDLTQGEVAQKVGLSSTGYGNIETGKSVPSLETLIKLADLFNVSLDYLTGRSEERR